MHASKLFLFFCPFGIENSFQYYTVSLKQSKRWEGRSAIQFLSHVVVTWKVIEKKNQNKLRVRLSISLYKHKLLVVPKQFVVTEPEQKESGIKTSIRKSRSSAPESRASVSHEVIAKSKPQFRGSCSHKRSRKISGTDGRNLPTFLRLKCHRCDRSNNNTTHHTCCGGATQNPGAVVHFLSLIKKFACFETHASLYIFWATGTLNKVSCLTCVLGSAHKAIDPSQQKCAENCVRRGKSKTFRKLQCENDRQNDTQCIQPPQGPQKRDLDRLSGLPTAPDAQGLLFRRFPGFRNQFQWGLRQSISDRDDFPALYDRETHYQQCQ